MYFIELQVFNDLVYYCVCGNVGGHGPGSARGDKIRVFRAEKSYAVTQGKWYFEFEAVTVGEMRVGWARPSVRADTELGADELAYVFNGFKVGSNCSTCERYHTLCNLTKVKNGLFYFSGPTLACGK